MFNRTSLVIRIILICILSLNFEQVLASSKLSASDASKHVGEKATVCGVVVGSHKATNSKGTPTFINLDERYPHQLFTILIWGDDLSKFSPSPSTWDGKRVCATGTITSYRGTPEIVAKDALQITVSE
jgi:hypothetical protein